jgi:hypothetical protein
MSWRPSPRIPTGTYASAAVRGSCVADRSADDYRAPKPYVVKSCLHAARHGSREALRSPSATRSPASKGVSAGRSDLLDPFGAGCEGSNPCGGTLKVKRRPAPSGDLADAPPTSRVTSALVGHPAHGLADGVARHLPGRVVQAPPGGGADVYGGRLRTASKSSNTVMNEALQTVRVAAVARFPRAVAHLRTGSEGTGTARPVLPIRRVRNGCSA